MTDEYRSYRDAEIKASGLTLKQWYSKRYIYSDHWKHLKQRKFELVGRRCEKCRSTKRIQVHHINYRNIYDVEPDDLQVLCQTCHKKEHGLNGSKKTNHQKKTIKSSRLTGNRKARDILKNRSIPADDRIKAVMRLFDGEPPKKVRRMLKRFRSWN